MHDAETRERLLVAATHLFSEQGFHRVTVRDICREADANVAAVSYYFGDKLALYKEVVRAAITALRRSDPTIEAPAGSSAEERIRHYVRTYVPRIAKPEGPAIEVHRFMSHEMQEPTPLAPWIAEQVILPRIRYLSEAMAELLGCSVDDPRVGRCVISLQSQCLFYLPNRFRRAALGKWDAAMDADLEQAAEHIAEFTLAGVTGMVEGGTRKGRR